MTQPQLSVGSLGDGKYLINQPSGTVALLSSQGYIDWLLQTPEQPGRLYTEIVKETHLSYTLGLKLLQTTPAEDAFRPIADGACPLVRS